MTNHEQIIIAGPCSAESEGQVLKCASTLKERGIDIMRASLWKPRTRPGFDGVGLEGSSWLAEVTRLGVTIGTEVLLPNQVTDLVEEIRHHHGDPAKLFFWLGSRNQNHLIQKEVAKRILGGTPDGVRLLIKNQPWSNESHWLGIVDHVIDAGIKHERIILCHRGFSPDGRSNPNNFRNPPDFDVAMRVREATELPMLLDPSHIGGSVENVFKTVKMAAGYSFDGLMIEVHPTPQSAQTDAEQQLTFEELDRLLLNK